MNDCSSAVKSVNDPLTASSNSSRASRKMSPRIPPPSAAMADPMSVMIAAAVTPLGRDSGSSPSGGWPG